MGGNAPRSTCDLVATSCDLSAISLRSCRDLKRFRCDPMRSSVISATSTRHVRSRGTRWSRTPGDLTEDKSSFGDDPMRLEQAPAMDRHGVDDSLSLVLVTTTVRSTGNVETTLTTTRSRWIPTSKRSHVCLTKILYLTCCKIPRQIPVSFYPLSQRVLCSSSRRR